MMNRSRGQSEDTPKPNGSCDPGVSICAHSSGGMSGAGASWAVARDSWLIVSTANRINSVWMCCEFCFMQLFVSFGIPDRCAKTCADDSDSRAVIVRANVVRFADLSKG